MIYQPMETKPFDPANHVVPYSEVRKRLMGKPRAKEKSRSHEVVTIETVRLRDMDDHVKTWRRWLKFLPVGRISSFVYRRCTELGVDYMAVIGPSRSDYIVSFRHQIMWEARTQLTPTPSYPEIGRAFGGRDHTSVVSACQKMEAICLRKGSIA